MIRPPEHFERMFRLRASNFLYGQKVTKEPSKVGGISISLPPLKSPLLETTNQGGFGPPIGCTPPGVGDNLKSPASEWGAEVNGPKGRCKPRGAECYNYFPVLSTCPGDGATTEPPRDGWKPGATVLVGASAYSSNTERQRAARGVVSWPLPAPDGYNLSPWWLPRK